MNFLRKMLGSRGRDLPDLSSIVDYPIAVQKILIINRINEIRFIQKYLRESTELENLTNMSKKKYVSKILINVKFDEWSVIFLSFE